MSGQRGSGRPLAIILSWLFGTEQSRSCHTRVAGIESSVDSVEEWPVRLIPTIMQDITASQHLASWIILLGQGGGRHERRADGHDAYPMHDETEAEAVFHNRDDLLGRPLVRKEELRKY